MGGNDINESTTWIEICTFQDREIMHRGDGYPGKHAPSASNLGIRPLHWPLYLGKDCIEGQSSPLAK